MVSLEVTIGGEGCRLVLHTHGYEFADEPPDHDDANWLLGRVELYAGQTGQFTARQDVSLRTTELSRFRDELRGILGALSGVATLEHLEDQLGCEVHIENGKGQLKAFVREHIGADLRVSEVPTDQSYLASTVEQLDSVLVAFPVRRGSSP